MSKAPEYTKKYPCPHCDEMKYGTAQLLAHIRKEHTDRPVKPKAKIEPWTPGGMLIRSLSIGFIVTVIYQIVENHHQGVMYGVEHGIIAMMLYVFIVVTVANLFSAFRR